MIITNCDSTLKSNYIDFLKEDNRNKLIVPTEKLSNELNKEYLIQTDKTISEPIIFSFNKFLIFLSEKLEMEIDLINEIMQSEILAECISSFDNGFFSKNNTRLVNTLISVINGLREEGLRSKDLYNEASDSNNGISIIRNHDKFSQICQLMESYENYLDNNNFDDNSKLINRITEILPHSNFENFNLYFNHFSTLRKPDSELINSLSKNNNIYFKTHFSVDDGPFLGNFKYLRESFESNFNFIDNRNVLTKAELSELENKIDYNSSFKPLSRNTSLIKEDNKQEEVYSIAQLCKFLIIKENYKPSDICIVSRNPSEYSELFKEFFADNSIPFNISDRFTLDKSPVIVSIFNLLDFILENARIEDFKKVLISGYIDIDLTEKDYFIRLTEENRLIGGVPSNKSNFLDIYIRSLSELTSNSDYNSEKIESIQSELSIIQDKLIIDKNKQYSISEFTNLIKTLLNKFKIKENIIKKDDLITNSKSENLNSILIERIERDSNSLKKFIQVLNEMEITFDRIYGEKTYSFKQLIDKLKSFSMLTKYQIRERKKYGVEITSLEQTRGLNFKIKILTGMVEGSFPIPYKTNKTIGRDLIESEAKHYSEELFQLFEFYYNSTADTRFYVFFPQLSNDSENIQSHFIDYLEGVQENENPHWKNFAINKRQISNISESEILIANHFYNSKDFEVDFNKLNKEAKKRFTNLSEYTSFSKIKNLQNKKDKFFYESVIGLSKTEAKEIALSSLEKGSLLHESMEEFFKQISALTKKKFIINNQNYYVTELNENDYKNYIDIFKSILQDKLNLLKHNHTVFEIETLLLFGNSQIEGLLIEWFKKEISDIIENNYYIFDFERMINTKIDFDGLELSVGGRIDRIDINDKGDLRIVDYKYSKSIESLQLVIYADLLSRDLNIELERIQTLKFSFLINNKNGKHIFNYKNVLTTKNKKYPEIREHFEELKNYKLIGGMDTYMGTPYQSILKD